MAARLLLVPEPERAHVLARLDKAQAAQLAVALKDACYAAWHADPQQCAVAATVLGQLAAREADSEIAALAQWTSGIAALAQGKMEAALVCLDEAHSIFVSREQMRQAVETRVPKVAALAMLGRYDEAEASASSARDAFERWGDGVAAGKIALNVGHMQLRRDRYADAERYFRQAQARFESVGDQASGLYVAAQLALADSLMWQRKFHDADTLYAQAASIAEARGLKAQLAQVRLNHGIMEHARGNFDHALRLLENARTAQEALGLPYETATAGQYLADTYLALNMAEEALVLYDSAIPLFAEEGLRYEQAWMLAHRAQALALLGLYAGRSSSA